VLVATTCSLRMFWALTMPVLDRIVSSFPLGASTRTDPVSVTSLTVLLIPETLIEPDSVLTSTSMSRGTCSSQRTSQAMAALHGRSATRKTSPSIRSSTNGRRSP
jgi:hypothetical protein